MDDIRTPANSSLPRKSTWEESTSGWSCDKYLTVSSTPVFFSSSENESPAVKSKSVFKSVENFSQSMHTPVGDKIMPSKKSLFASKLQNDLKNSASDLIVNKEKGNGSVRKKVFDSGKQEVLQSQVVDSFSSDSDKENFQIYKKSHKKVLTITESSTENSSSEEKSIPILKSKNMSSASMNDSVQPKSVINELTSYVASNLTIDGTRSISQKLNSLHSRNSFRGRKFRPLILNSEDELSSDESISTPSKKCSSSFKTFDAKREKPKVNFLKSLSPSIPVTQADPEAVKYRTEFKSRKLELTKKLFLLYNEKIFGNKLPTDMIIEWNDRLTKTAGLANYRSSGGVKTCSISLSTKVVDSADRLRDTLMHEMCHAAVWLVHGMSVGHGPLWQTWAMRCLITFPDIKVPKRCHTYDINYKYQYKCTNCNYSMGRHSKSIDVNKHLCPYCHKSFKLVK